MHRRPCYRRDADATHPWSGDRQMIRKALDRLVLKAPMRAWPGFMEVTPLVAFLVPPLHYAFWFQSHGRLSPLALLTAVAWTAGSLGRLGVTVAWGIRRNRPLLKPAVAIQYLRALCTVFSVAAIISWRADLAILSLYLGEGVQLLAGITGSGYSALWHLALLLAATTGVLTGNVSVVLLSGLLMAAWMIVTMCKVPGGSLAHAVHTLPDCRQAVRCGCGHLAGTESGGAYILRTACEAGLWDAAEETLEAEVQAGLDRLSETRWRIRILIGKGQAGQALQLLKSRQDLTDRLRVATALILSGVGRNEEALELARLAILKGDRGAELALGCVLDAMGDYDGAIHSFGVASRRMLERPEALLRAARCLVKAGEPATAATVYNIAVRIGKCVNPEHLQEMARAHEAAGNLAAAREVRTLCDSLDAALEAAECCGGSLGD